jgi:hypothetical protein
MPLAALLLAGCMKWSGASDPVDQYVRAEDPWQVRLTLTDGSVVPLWDVEMVGDTVVGFTVRPSHSPSTRAWQPRAGYPLDQVARLEEHRLDPVLTLIVPAITIGALLGIAWLACCSTDGTGSW